MGETSKAAGIGDEAVRARTGKTWAEWFTLLDAAGAKEMTHPQITAILDAQGIDGWWCQMVTVGYEQERGLRQKHQKTDGFAAGVSRTFAVPLAALYAAWHDERTRRRWLGDHALTIRKVTQDKSMRITWAVDGTNVEVNFYAKGAAKSQAAVQHGKLAGPDDVERLKAFWAEALDRLKGLLGAAPA